MTRTSDLCALIVVISHYTVSLDNNTAWMMPKSKIEYYL